MGDGEAKILNQNAAYKSTGADDAYKSILTNVKGVCDESFRPPFFIPDEWQFTDEHWTGSDIRGTKGWLSGVANSATVGVISTVAEAAHPGVVGLSTQSLATGRASVYSADSNGAGCGSFLSGTELVMRWVVKVTTLATLGTDEFFVKIGMANNVSSSTEACLNGVVFSYKATSSLNWEIVATKASVETRVTTSVPVTTGWVILEAKIEDGTMMNFYIDNQPVGSIALTSLPTSSTVLGLHARINKTLGTSNRNLYLDRCSFLSR
jgi:hypothetical protein